MYILLLNLANQVILLLRKKLKKMQLSKLYRRNGKENPKDWIRRKMDSMQKIH